MSEEISHIGIVKVVGKEETTVEIVSNSACGQCHASSLCGVAESAKKKIVVANDHEVSYAVGDEVEVVLRQSMGDKAVWISYVIPLVILLAIVVSLSYAGLQEWSAGFAGIAALGLYYLAVWMMRDRISRDYVFEIKRKKL